MSIQSTFSMTTVHETSKDAQDSDEIYDVSLMTLFRIISERKRRCIPIRIETDLIF